MSLGQLLCWIIAGILFVVAAVVPLEPYRLRIVSAGLASLTLGFILPGLAAL